VKKGVDDNFATLKQILERARNWRSLDGDGRVVSQPLRQVLSAFGFAGLGIW